MRLKPHYIIAVLMFVSCHKQAERKTILLYDGDYTEQAEVLNGAVKEISISTSSASGTLLFQSHIYFDKKGNLLQSNNKSLAGFTPVCDTITYTTAYNNAGKKVTMTCSHSGWTYPSKQVSMWIFDTSGRAIQYRILWDTTKNIGPETNFQYNSISHLQLKKVSGRNLLGREAEPDLYKYTYGINNRLIQLEWYTIKQDKHEEQLRSVMNFEYEEFDLRYNWTRRIEHLPRVVQTDGTLNAWSGSGYITTRKITYY